MCKKIRDRVVRIPVLKSSYFHRSRIETEYRFDKFKESCSISSSIIFVSISLIVFIQQVTLIRFPPPWISWDHLISAEYHQHLQFAECVPFFLFLICLLGIGVYSLLSTVRKHLKAKKGNESGVD